MSKPQYFFPRNIFYYKIIDKIFAPWILCFINYCEFTVIIASDETPKSKQDALFRN